MKKIISIFLFLSVVAFVIAATTKIHVPVFSQLIEKNEAEEVPSDDNFTNEPTAIKDTTFYKNEWKVVDSLKSKGLYESALKKVEEIKTMAIKDKNAAQAYKALNFIIPNLKIDNGEEFFVYVDKELKTAFEPYKQLVYLVKANLFKAAINAGVTSLPKNYEGIENWTQEQVVKKYLDNIYLALGNEALLQSIPVENHYEFILERVIPESRKYRATLYDLLIQAVISELSNTRFNLTQPAESFNINQAQFFAPVAEFIKNPITSPDTLNVQFQTLKMMQAALRANEKAKNTDALVDNDLARLNYLLNNTVLDNKNALYIAALNNLYNQYKDVEASTMIAFAKASLYADLAKTYSFQDTSSYKYKNLAKEAHTICENAIKSFPESFGAKQCKVLLASIERTELNFFTNQVVAPAQALLFQVNYLNVDKIYVRYEKANYYINNSDLASYQFKNPTVTELNVTNPKDYLRHNTEFYLPGLEVGYYMIQISNSPQFELTKEQEEKKSNDVKTSNLAVWVTNLNYQLNRSEGEIYVFNPTTGQPLKDVSVDLYEEIYRSGEDKYVHRNTAKTNQDGIAKIKATNYSNYYIGLKYKNDQYFKSEYLYLRERSKETPRVYNQFTMFLDRAIYRPGQIVYFKGLVNTNEGLNAKTVAGEKLKVEIKDPNYKTVYAEDFKTNEFGTYSGSFALPTGGLNGNFTFLVNGKYVQNFRVEDYKRPQFEVKLEQPKGQYKVNDTVKVEGNAMALGGFAVSNAQVKFSVIRRTNYPWYRMRYMPYSNDAQKITDGVVTADANGKFTFSFKALPNVKVSAKNEPIFNYEVSVDVTDLSGETRAANISIPIGYKSLSLTNSLSENIDLAHLPTSISVKATNLSGEPIETAVKITAQKLYYKNKAFVARPFEPAEFTTIAEAEFDRLFPLYPFKYENLEENMPVDKTVYTKTIMVGKDTLVTKSFFSALEEGYYSILMEGKDAFGQEVKTTQYIKVINSGAKKPIVPTFFQMNVQKSSGKVGEKASLWASTTEKDVLMVLEEVNKGNIVKRQYIKLSNQNYTFEVPLTKAMEDGSVYYNFYVNYKGQTFSSTLHPVSINTAKDLNVKLITERKILEPNSKEKWSITIQNDQKQAVKDAELLVSMYDASLDFFVKQNWNFTPNNNVYYANNIRTSNVIYLVHGQGKYYLNLPSYDAIIYERIQMRYRGMYHFMGYGNIKADETKQGNVVIRSSSLINMGKGIATKNEISTKKNKSLESGFSAAPAVEEAEMAADAVNVETETSTDNETEALATRTNFNETAFFYPAIYANDKGEYEFSFTMPEAITRWNFNAFAVTKSLQYGFTSTSVVTQKQLMVNTFAPVFLREKDTLYFSAKITNLTDANVAAKTEIQFINALTGKNITAEIVKEAVNKQVSIQKGESVSVKWKTIIPTTVEAITYKVTAQTEKHQDGEEKTIPVLKNRMLVTETLPLWVRSSSQKAFEFSNLDKLAQSKTIQSQSFTLEFTSNPAWYAVLSLPYLMEYPYECSEQTMSRIYANALAKHVVDQNPSIKAVFETWKTLQPDALLSNLEKNQELKSILLEETPWLRNANNESERKRRIALLFDLNQMSNAYQSDLQKLQQMQLSSGAWPWFKGGKEDRYITQYIVTNIGKLAQLGVKNDAALQKIAEKAMVYLDEQIKIDYDNLVKSKVDLKDYKPGNFVINYFYMRSFYKETAVKTASKTAYDYFFGQLKKYWLNDNIYMQAQLATIFHRFGEEKIAKDIMKSVEELSYQSEEMGKYWKANRGYYWYEAPIETQAMLIETYSEITPENTTAIEEMKLWLLKNKQTNDWKTTVATSEAIYALLLRGNQMLSIEKYPVISLGKMEINPNTDENIRPEAGTGYFKVNIPNNKIDASLKNIKIDNPNNVPAWGAVYWQYFEDLDKITPAKTGLQIDKKLFVERNGARGKELEPITSKTVLKVGDRVKVRMEIRSDRNLEYVHIKDMRASCFQPENVLSGYRWQNGVGYYESTRDAATNFFVSHLRKGTYIFEYPMLITHEGDFSNGITSIQCMYAPEFASHSEGIRVKVK